MKIHAFRFTAKQLRGFDPDHLGFVIAACHCCNELRAFTLYVIFEADSVRLLEAEKAMVTVRQLTILRSAVSKILEFDDCCLKYLKRIRTGYPELWGEMQSFYKPISDKIRAQAWARRLRNKVSFHYDQKYAFDSLSNLSESTDLSILLGPTDGLTVFSFAEEIVSTPIFVEAGDGDLKRGVETASEFAIEMQRKLTNFVAYVLTNSFKSAGLFQRDESVELRESYGAREGSVEIPIWFIPDTPDT